MIVFMMHKNHFKRVLAFIRNGELVNKKNMITSLKFSRFACFLIGKEPFCRYSASASKTITSRNQIFTKQFSSKLQIFQAFSD